MWLSCDKRGISWISISEPHRIENTWDIGKEYTIANGFWKDNLPKITWEDDPVYFEINTF